MDSGGSISRVGARMMPFLAILSDEWRGLWSSWLVRLWLIASALMTLLTLASNWAGMQSAPFIGTLLFPFLVFPWFLVAIVLGISPVTGTRLEALADGILSRPVTRYEFLLASWAARVAVVLTVFLVVLIPAVLLVALANRPAPEDTVTSYGILASLALVSLVLTFLVSLGFLVGTLLRRPLLAAVILIFIWFPANLVLHTFSLEEFSPISLNQAIPVLLRTPWRQSDNGSEVADAAEMQAMADQGARFLSILAGETRPPRQEQPEFFEQGDYEDFSLLRVVLGYGLSLIHI